MGFWRKWKGLIILLLIMGVLVYFYTAWNGGDTEGNFVKFLKTDVLRMLIIAVGVAAGLFILKKIFKRAPWQR